MEDLIKRIKNAIIILNDGHPFTVGGLLMALKDDLLIVSGDSQYIDLRYMTSNGALKELDEIKNLFRTMVSNSIDLKNFIIDKKIKFNLDFDYGMGYIKICSETDGLITWEYKIKD